MYSVVRIFEGGGHAASDALEAAHARAEVIGRAVGFVTLLAILADDSSLVTVEIFETQDDMAAGPGAEGSGASHPPSRDEPECNRTITGEIVFQRGL